MGLFGKDVSKGREELRSARAGLARVSASDKRRGVRDETPAYLRANSRVAKAERALPWWAR